MLHKQNILNEKIIFSNTSPTVPLSITFGGLFSRGLKFDFIGVPLLVKEAKQSYFKKELIYMDIRMATIEDLKAITDVESRCFPVDEALLQKMISKRGK